MDYSSGEFFYIIAGAFSCSAYVLKNILWLRILLVIASTIYIFTGIKMGITSMIGWNTAYFIINLYHVSQLVLDKITFNLPADTVDIYHRYFSTLSTREFKKLILNNEFITLNNQSILKQDEVTDKLYMIIDGDVDIVRQQRCIAKLTVGDMIGEMSFMTKDPASAHANARGEVKCAYWTHDDLEKLKLKNQSMYNRFIAIIGCDLVRKLRKSHDSMGASDTQLDYIL